MTGCEQQTANLNECHMSQPTVIFKLAAIAALAIAALHFAASAMAGFPPDTLPVIITGGLWLLFAAGLRTGKRWLAYLAFVFSIVSGLVHYAQFGAQFGSASTIAFWLSVAMLAVTLVLTVFLFIVIWRNPNKAA